MNYTLKVNEGNYGHMEDYHKLKFNFKKIKATDPPSESLKKIKTLILKSILKLARIYSSDKNKEFLTSQYIKQSELIRYQIDEYYNLMRKIKISKINEIDALILTVNSYKEACRLLDTNKNI